MSHTATLLLTHFTQTMSLRIIHNISDGIIDAVRRKKQEKQKVQETLSHLWGIPLQVLNQTIQTTESEGKEVQEFKTYRTLSSKECQPHRNFQ